MPKELLSISKKAEKLLKPLLKHLPQRKSSVKEAEPEESLLGINLLVDEDSMESSNKLSLDEATQYYHSPYLVLGAQIIISALTAVFLILTLMNARMNAVIRKDNALIEEKIRQIESTDEGDLLDLKLISEKIDLHKRYKSEDFSFSPLLPIFYESFPGFVYRNLQINRENVSITATTKSPLTFTAVSLFYLDNELIDQVILKSASFNKSEQEFNLNMEVVLK